MRAPAAFHIAFRWSCGVVPWWWSRGGGPVVVVPWRWFRGGGSVVWSRGGGPMVVVPWWWSRGGGPVVVVRGGGPWWWSVVVVPDGGPWGSVVWSRGGGPVVVVRVCGPVSVVVVRGGVVVVRPPATDVSFILRYIYVIGDCFLHSNSWILSGLELSEKDLGNRVLF